jgi:hypothetical protein
MVEIRKSVPLGKKKKRTTGERGRKNNPSAGGAGVPFFI